MKDLLQNFSIQQILLFIVCLAIAIRGVGSWFDWVKEKEEKMLEKKNKHNALKESVDNLIKSQESMKCDINACQSQLKATIDGISKSITLLTESDKDDIKAWITEKHHHFCYELGYIDDYSLDCIEKRYSHYKEEGGNTFIDNFMEEIRALPKKSEVNLYSEKNEN